MPNTIVFCANLLHGQAVGMYRGFSKFFKKLIPVEILCIWHEICVAILYKTFFWNFCLSYSNTQKYYYKYTEKLHLKCSDIFVRL